MYAGTPKRSTGTLGKIWGRSTQCEYAIKSSRSGHWNILGMDNIGPHGLIDAKSGLPLDLNKDKGEWVSTYSLTQPPKIEGYRVCALHFVNAPWINWDNDILGKLENYSKASFYNEVLGQPYDSGTMPITREQLIAACNPDIRTTETPQGQTYGRKTIIGVDYGPVHSEASHTVAVGIQEHGGFIQVVLLKKFLGKEADYAHIHDEVPRMFKT